MTTEPRTGLVLAPERMDRDPRLTLDEGALVLASRNAYPVVARAPGKRGDNGLVVGGAIALLLGGLTFWTLASHRTQPPAPLPPPAPVRQVLAPPRPSVPVIAPLPAAPILAPHVAPTLVTTIAPGADAAHSPVVVYDQSAGTRTQTIPAPAPAIMPATRETVVRPPFVGGGATDNDQFAARVGGTGDVATARRLSDPSTTVTQGTLIPAVLETAIDTDLPGYVRALVAQDVRSFDGTRVLIPRSSRLIGQYKSGLQAGQTRAYVIWSRLIRPDGASVALGSPAVDFAGRSGLDGKVDSHFIKRFGSAALLSVVGGLASIGNSAVVLAGGQSAASVAAQRDTQIPPTIKVPQGQPIRVFTAKDLDFSTVGPEAP